MRVAGGRVSLGSPMSRPAAQRRRGRSPRSARVGEPKAGPGTELAQAGDCSCAGYRSVDPHVRPADSRTDMIATNEPRPAGRDEPPGPGPEVAEPTAEEAARQVARLFPEVYRHYHWARRVDGAELPLTRRGLEVLVHLAAAGPLTVGEQAAHLGLRRNSASELLGRLESKGLVARIRDERDTRRVLVWLTEPGRRVVARVGQVLAPDLLAGVMATLTPAERATVVSGFELLAAAGARAAGPRSGVSDRTERRDP